MSQLEGLAELSHQQVMSVWRSAQLHSPLAGRVDSGVFFGGVNEAEVCGVDQCEFDILNSAEWCRAGCK